MFKKLGYSAIAASSVLAGTASAEESSGTSIDVSGAEETLGNVEGALTTIGGVVIGLAAVAIAFKWVKGMIFS